jgi:hypothetical protein
MSFTLKEDRDKIVEYILKYGGAGFSCPWCHQSFDHEQWSIEEDDQGGALFINSRIFVIVCPRCGYTASFRAPIRGRKTQVLRDGAWVDVSFESLRKGDVFRLFDIKGTDSEVARRMGAPPPEEQRVIIDDAFEFRALGAPYYHDGNLRIEHEAVTLEKKED